MLFPLVAPLIDGWSELQSSCFSEDLADWGCSLLRCLLVLVPCSWLSCLLEQAHNELRLNTRIKICDPYYKYSSIIAASAFYACQDAELHNPVQYLTSIFMDSFLVLSSCVLFKAAFSFWWPTLMAVAFQIFWPQPTEKSFYIVLSTHTHTHTHKLKQKFLGTIPSNCFWGTLF